MDTDELLLVKLLWPSPPDDKAERKHHRAVLSAARKCLVAKAPMELVGTGMYLLPERYEPDLRECLADILVRAELDPLACLIAMRAPEMDVYSRALYANSVAYLQAQFTLQCEEAAARIYTTKITVRFLDKVFEALYDILLYTQTAEFKKYKHYLELMSAPDINKNKDKYAGYLTKLGARCSRYNWSDYV